MSGFEEPLRLVFTEDHLLFRFMEMAVTRRPSEHAERALVYAFADAADLARGKLLTLADDVGLPPHVDAVVCTNASALDAALATADLVVAGRRSLDAGRLRLCAGRTQLIQRFGRMTDSIDLAVAESAGVPIAALSRRTSQSVAEHTLMFILAQAHRLTEANARVRTHATDSKPAFAEGQPVNRFNWSGMQGIRSVAGCTLGIIGMGEIGAEVARRAAALGMRVLYTKRRPLAPVQERELGDVRHASEDTVLSESDFVSLHLPLTPETEGFMDARRLDRMRPGSVLVNTARGALVDERALYRSLTEGHLAGACLDVYRYEPVPGPCPLLRLENVLWTPHVAGGDPALMLGEVEDVLGNLARAARGETPRGIVSSRGRG